MRYETIVERKARKAIARLPSTAYGRVMDAIEDLAEDPRPRNTRKLQDREGYRLRIGDYRIIYRADDEERVVTVLEVWHRQRDYR